MAAVYPVRQKPNAVIRAKVKMFLFGHRLTLYDAAMTFPVILAPFSSVVVS